MQAPVRHRTGRQHRVCGNQRRLPLRAGVIRGSPCAAAFAERHLIKDVADEREIIRAELLSTCLENWMAPTSAVTHCGDAIYVSGFPPFDPASGTVIEAPIERQTGSAAAEGRTRHIGRRTMKAIIVTEQSAGTAGMKLVERPEPQPAINDVVVQIHASGFVPTEMEWPSTWTDRRDHDRTPSIPGHELAGVVTALGWGTTGLSVGQRVLGLADWHRDGTLAEYVAIEARNLAPLPGDVDFTVGASLPISGLTAWQGLFQL